MIPKAANIAKRTAAGTVRFAMFALDVALFRLLPEQVGAP